ncbi:MAG: lysozyme inhibitor LprI family protein [Pseudomonadota bacterium]
MSFQSWEDPPLTMGREQPPPSPPDFEPEPEPRRLSRNVLIWGVAVACVLGLGLGLIARPDLIGRGPEPAPMQPRPATSEGQIEVVVADPPPAPPIVERPPLETMSPELIQATPKAAPPSMTLPRLPQPRPAPAPDPAEVPDALQSAIDASVRAPAPAQGARPSFDCRRARSQAEEMICSDPALAAADRQLARAFQRALRAGAPYDELRGEQDDWLEIREDAARRSPRAVASVYDQRIEELNALADEAGRRW